MYLPDFIADCRIMWYKVLAGAVTVYSFSCSVPRVHLINSQSIITNIGSTISKTTKLTNKAKEAKSMLNYRELRNLGATPLSLLTRLVLMGLSDVILFLGGCKVHTFTPRVLNSCFYFNQNALQVEQLWHLVEEATT